MTTIVDIKESAQLYKERKPLRLAEVLESSKKQFIRTMQKDIESLQKDQPAKPSISKADQIKEAAPPAQLPVAEGLKKEAGIKERIEETQKRLEEERMRAEMTRQKAEPVPPKLPTLPKPIPPKPVPLKKELPLKKEVKPAIKKSRLKFVFVGLAVILIIGGIGGFFYWWNYLRPVPPPPPPVTYYQCQDEQCIEVEGQGDDLCLSDEDCQPIEPVEPTVPDSLIPVDETKTIELTIGQEDLLLDELKSVAAQEQAQGTFKRILVKLISPTEKKYAQLDVLASDLGINIPAAILQAAAASEIEAGNYTLVLYDQAGGSRLGIIIDMGQSATLIQDLKNWEGTIVADLKPMLLRNEIPAGFTEQFQDNTYQEVAIRYMNFPMPDLSLDYGIVNEKLILTTSRDSMYAMIDALLASPADTTNWQIYRNEEYGFEMKYPANWGEATEEEKAQVSTVLAVFDMSVLDRDILAERAIEASIDIFVLDNSEKKSLDSFSLERTGGENIIPRKSFKINELDAIQAGYNFTTMNILEVSNMIELSLEKIVYIDLMAQSDFQDDLDIFNQILSTFKFNDISQEQSEFADCGTTDIFQTSDPSDQNALHGDLTLTCLGENMLNNCKKSEAVLQTEDTGEGIKYIILGGKDDICDIRLEFEKTNLTCPVSLKIIIEQSSDDRTLENPADIAGAAYIYINFVSNAPDTECIETSSE